MAPFDPGRGTVGGGTGARSHTVHAGSRSWQVPSLEVTSLVSPVVLDGRGSSTFTVKRTVTEVGVVAVAAGTSELLGDCAAFAGGATELAEGQGGQVDQCSP